jgi:hypothetical protein
MIWSSLFSWRLLETKYRCSQLLINFSRFAYIARVDYGDYSAHWIISCHDIRSGGSNNELAYVNYSASFTSVSMLLFLSSQDSIVVDAQEVKSIRTTSG